MKWEERFVINPTNGWLFLDFIFKRTAYSLTTDIHGEGYREWSLFIITKRQPYEEMGSGWLEIGEAHVPRCILYRAREITATLLLANEHLVEK